VLQSGVIRKALTDIAENLLRKN